MAEERDDQETGGTESQQNQQQTTGQQGQQQFGQQGQQGQQSEFGQQQQGFKILPKRWIAERTLGWFNRYRRLSKDYERWVDVSKGMVYSRPFGGCSAGSIVITIRLKS